MATHIDYLKTTRALHPIEVETAHERGRQLGYSEGALAMKAQSAGRVWQAAAVAYLLGMLTVAGAAVIGALVA
jgi:hypothetical protein